MRAVLRWVAIGAALVLVVSAGLGLAAYRRFNGNIRTDSAGERVLARYAGQRPRPLVPAARNILVMGADTGRSAADGAGPPADADAGPSSPRLRPRPADPQAAVLLHLSADRGRAAALAVPRDLMVRAPNCRGPDGEANPVAYEPFSDAFRDGGAACAIRAFERLSGVRVDHHLVVDVAGFRKIAGAVGAGTGDHRGELLRALVRETDRGTLAHPARLYGLLETATSSITADPGLSSLPALYQLAGSLRALPADRLVLRTVPVSAAAGGRDVPREPDADRLFAAVRADRPLPDGSGSPGSPGSPARAGGSVASGTAGARQWAR
jgi:LytR_cpsA_psr family